MNRKIDSAPSGQNMVKQELSRLGSFLEQIEGITSSSLSETSLKWEYTNEEAGLRTVITCKPGTTIAEQKPTLSMSCLFLSISKASNIIQEVASFKTEGSLIVLNNSISIIEGPPTIEINLIGEEYLDETLVPFHISINSKRKRAKCVVSK